MESDTPSGKPGLAAAQSPGHAVDPRRAIATYQAGSHHARQAATTRRSRGVPADLPRAWRFGEGAECRRLACAIRAEGSVDNRFVLGGAHTVLRPIFPILRPFLRHVPRRHTRVAADHRCTHYMVALGHGRTRSRQ